jgi:hypothetical protein
MAQASVPSVQDSLRKAAEAQQAVTDAARKAADAAKAPAPAKGGKA